MRIGVPKEIKPQENRIGLTPESVKDLIKNGHEVATLHAEQNTIIDCAKRGISCANSQAYVTHFPCLTCTKLLIASGITSIYYIRER